MLAQRHRILRALLAERRGTDEDYVVTTRGKLLDRLRALLAGRAAQEVVLGAATTYDAEALGAAVRVALKMVTSYGMGAGPLQRWAPVIEGQQPLMVSFDGGRCSHARLPSARTAVPLA